ncbi:MAG: NAD-glutamate dehydrogenase domain-containing protein [Parachlamydiales bacterium]|jgi:glutamate dehydrogenase
MENVTKDLPSINNDLNATIHKESERFQEFYTWLEKNMPPILYEEIGREYLIVVARTLMGFHLQDYFSLIQFGHFAIVMCQDSTDADLKILKNFSMYGIRNYQSYISKAPPPVPGIKANLRIAAVYFIESSAEVQTNPYTPETKEHLRSLVNVRNSSITDGEFEQIFNSFSLRFLRSLSTERLVLAIDMFHRATTRDSCQYEVRYNEDWQEKSSVSMQIVLAWRNCPKNNFLYRMAGVIHRHQLVIKRVNASYVNSFSKDGILVMALGLHGSNGKPAWEIENIHDFLREFVTIKYFEDGDPVEKMLVSTGYVSGNEGNLVRTIVTFIHQALVHIDQNLYTLDNIVEALCRHPELTAHICEAFRSKFDPWNTNIDTYLKLKKRIVNDISKIDTGHEDNDIRRKNVLTQGINFVNFTLKTNFYRTNFTALSFRLDPLYLEEIPFNRPAFFPVLPFAIIFVKGMYTFSFHIRFKDLSRGGVRTIYPEQKERMLVEINRVFTECYNLAYTQDKKNKDIPEGGAKAVIFVKPYEQLDLETDILARELGASGLNKKDIDAKVDNYRKEQKLEYLHHAQRTFVEALITIVNCEANGKLKAKHVLDFWQKPEYLYLGPDENMHDSMIEWIAEYSKKHNYKPGSAFISGKPILGINHKEYGVTSLGLNVYLEYVLKQLGIDPYKNVFTVKISGGPDGDVAGNEICNLQRYYPKTAKILALTDASGTIYDPKGLNLDILVDLFKQGKPIRHYPPEELHEEGFLVDRETSRSKNTFSQQTLCWKKINGKVVEEWHSGNDMNHLWRRNVHVISTDVFIPAGGRPKTLNGANVSEFLDPSGKPTAKAIVEGANLYLDDDARYFLEDLGVLIIKDSSANKTGVICSSFEVLSGLTLGDKGFLENKPALVEEILHRLRLVAGLEANLLLTTFNENGGRLTDISDEISARINHFFDQILEYLDSIDLPSNPEDPLIRCFLNYCLPLLRTKHLHALLEQIPPNHKKAIIACFLSADTVYKRGLSWLPSIVDVLPVILHENCEPEQGASPPAPPPKA